jgi:DNA adenine methylase
VKASSPRPPVPFLKWAGGKGQLVAQLDRLLPKQFHTYHEPFLGGGAVFFHIRPHRAVLADSNPDLIDTFLAVRDDPRGLMAALDRHGVGRLSEDYFYHVRDKVEPSQLTRVERAARTVFLNKTCFNGLYRVNAKGKFNVPWGGYRNPRLYDRLNLVHASRLLRGKKILLADYRRALATANLGDFVYLDPPYHPLSETSRFTSYTKEDFGEQDQRNLAETCRRLDKRGVLFALSNSPTPLVLSLYEGFRLERLRAKRAISSKGTGRGPIDELLVMNYS